MKPRLSTEVIAEICQWYQEGETSVEIAKAYGFSYATIYRNLKKCGVKIRTPGEWNVRQLTGQIFGDLTVLDQAESGNMGQARWRCKCFCGVEKVIAGRDLVSGNTKSCGCLAKLAMEHQTTHGLSGTLQYTMFVGAKGRAKKHGLEFNITLDDIVIPEKCPITGRPLRKISSNGKFCNDSPSLDRINNAFGYIKGNVAVISYKANSRKSDMTLEEVNRLRNYMMSNNPNPVAAD